MVNMTRFGIGPAHHPSIDERMKMSAIGQAWVFALMNRPPPNRKESLKDGVGIDQQSKPWRYAGITLHEQDRESCNDKANQLCATVTQEDQAFRIVPDKKSSN